MGVTAIPGSEQCRRQPQRAAPVAAKWRKGLIGAFTPAHAPAAGNGLKAQGYGWTTSGGIVSIPVRPQTVQDFTLCVLVNMGASGYATAVSLESSGFANTLAIMGRVYPSQLLGAQIAYSDVNFAVVWQPGPAVLTLTRIGSTAYVDVNGVEVYTGSIDSSSATVDKLKLLAKTDSNLDQPSNGYAAFAAAWSVPRTPAERRCLTMDGVWRVFGRRRVRAFMPAAGGNTYSVSATEAATAADSQAAAMLFAATRTEAATAVETIAAALAAAAVRTEAATASEAASALLVIPATGTEAATASEASTTGTVSSNSVTETATASEAASALKQLAASLTEAATAADLVTALLVAVATVAEAASATQTASADPQFYADVTETASTADALQAAASLVAQVTESAAASDAFTRAAQLVALITEPASAADATAGTVPTGYSVSIAELATALDTLVATLVSGGGPAVQAAISAARRARFGLAATRPAQVSTTRRPRS